MAAICVAMTVSSILWVSNALYKATEPALLHRIIALRLLPTVGALIVGLHWGIVGVASAQIVAAVINLALELVVARRALGISLRAVFAAIHPR